MALRKVSFENDEGDELVGRLELPPDDEPIACALFAHCFTCGKDVRAAGAISRALTRQGIAVLRFDFTGLGESEGEFAQTNFSSNVADLVAAARFMEGSYEPPAILVGHSLGGAAVLQAAGHLESVRAVATIGAPADPGHVQQLLEEDLEAIREALRTLLAEDRRETIRDLARRMAGTLATAASAPTAPAPMSVLLSALIVCLVVCST